MAKFIRAFKPTDIDSKKINKALDIVESPWPKRDENLLKEQLHIQNDQEVEKSKQLIK